MLCCNRFIMFFTQIIHKKQNIFNLISTLRSMAVWYNSWHTGTGIKWTGKRSYWVEEGKKVGDGRVEGLSAIGDGRQAAVSVTPHVDGTGSGSLLDSVLSSSLKKWFSDVCLCSASQSCPDLCGPISCSLSGSSGHASVWLVALFFSHHRWHHSTGLLSEWLLEPFVYCSVFTSWPQKLIVLPHIKKTPCRFLQHEPLQFFSYFFVLLSLFVLSLGLQFQ